MNQKLLLVILLWNISSGFSAPADEARTWNSILGASRHVFPLEFDTIRQDNEHWTQQLRKFTDALNDPVIGIHAIYINFLKSYGKYSTQPITADRLKIFQKKLIQIAAHNLKADFEGSSVSRKAINAFSDMTYEEFLTKYTGHTVTNSTVGLDLVVEIPLGQAPDEKDWRSSGDVTKIKNQQSCGSCVAHACCAALESAYSIQKGKKNLDLSEQEILDCTRITCSGGGDWPDAFDYMIKKGVTTEDKYRYVNRKQSCTASNKARSAKATKWGYISRRSGGEDKIKDVVGTSGPVVAGIHVSNELQDAGTDVFTGPCDGNINHAVTIIGYGEENGQEYWLIKNSWGTSWADNGVGKIARGSNTCKISMDAAQVVV